MSIIKLPSKSAAVLSTAVLSMGAVATAPMVLPVAYAEVATASNEATQHVYVDESVSRTGNGSENQPFKTFEEAVQYAKRINATNGSLVEIHLKNNVTVSSDQDVIIEGKSPSGNEQPAYIVNGHNNTLTIRGQNLKIMQATAFRDINLSFLRDGSTNLPTVVVASPNVTFDNVTT